MPTSNPVPVSLPPDPIVTGVQDTDLDQYINHVTNTVPVPEPMINCYILLGIVLAVIFAIARGKDKDGGAA